MTHSSLTRRRFISSGAAAYLAAGGAAIAASRFDQLRKAIRGSVITPWDAAYRLKSKPWNARFAHVLPAAVVAVADAADVAETIKFAREHRIDFTVRNGRHSFGGFSATTGLIIDVAALASVRVDRAQQRATFGAGQTNLPLYTALWPSRMTLPAGTCPTVGVTGLSAAAGFGRLSRLYGLTCDNILELKLVNAAGELVTASDRENADLFWACRGGGGGNFGAVVELTARVHPVDMLFTEITYTFPISHAVSVMMAVQQFVEHLPDNGHCWTEIDTRAPKEGAAVVVEFTFAGPEARARTLGQELIGAAGVQPSKTSVVTEPYLSTMRDWICGGLRPDECGYAGVSPGSIPRPALYAKSDLIRKHWPPEAFAALAEAIERRQADRVLTPNDFEGAVNVGKIAFESAGGAIGRASGESAFAHHDIRYVVQYQSRWREGASSAVAQANIDWTHRTYEAVRPWLSGSAYQGYADPYLADWPKQYYGSSLPRLRTVKAKYDPDNIFRYAQSIGPV